MARPFLVNLSSTLGETVDLAAIKQDHLVFIDQVVGSQRLRAVSAVGEAFPLYCTANGKAYLAQLGDDAIAQLVGRQLPEPRTRQHLDAPRRAAGGSAHGAQDRRCLRPRGAHRGICAAGVAMRDIVGNFVAISVPVPAQRFYEHQRFIADRLLATKRALEDHLSAAAAA